MDNLTSSQTQKDPLKRVNGHQRQVEVRGIKVKRKPMFDQSGKILLNGVQLSFEKGFGFNQQPQMKNNAYCIDDNRIIYVLAKQIIVYDMLAETQKVVDSIGQQEQITCFLYFKNIMLDDNAIYSVQAINKTYPSVVLHNFSKGNQNKYVLAHLEKQQKVIEISLLNENRHFCIISQLQGTYRLSIMEIQTKELFASESIYFKPKGLLVPLHYPRTIFIYSQNEIYMILLDNQIKLIPLNLRKSLPDTQQTLTQIVCSVNSDVTLYGITNKGYLHLMRINLVSNQISKIDSVFLGQYETLPSLNEELSATQIQPQKQQNDRVTQDKIVQLTINKINPKKVKKNRIPSTICCNQYNIIIGYYFVQEFTLVKISSVGRQMLSSQSNRFQQKSQKNICLQSIYKSNDFEHIKFSCPYLHKILRMNFAHETMAICVTVQVKENDKYGLTVPLQSQFLKQKGQQKIIKQNVYNHSLPKGKIFPIVFNLLLHDTLVQTLRSPVQSILSSTLLVKQILDISVLPTKKLFLILSAQRKIKAIKYQHVSSTSFQRMLAWETTFNPSDQASSLDTHPLTFNVAVGFKQGIKIFNICSQGLKTANIQFPMKNCQSVRYSKYGHILVAGSSNQIVIINPYEHKITNSIQLGHGYLVKELTFIDRDMYLFGNFSNGSNMVVNLETGNKIFELWNKNAKMVSSVYDYTFDIMVVSYTECLTKFYRDHGEQQFAVMWTYPYNITKMLVCNQLGTIFMGTSLGKIRCHQWPFTDMMKFNKSYTQIQLHTSSITQIKVTHDLSMIISGSEDGSIFISKINAYSDGIIVNDSEMMHTFRTVNKNYMSLYYLQNYMCTNSNIQSQQEQAIVQLESDKADFQSQHSEIIMGLQRQNQLKVKRQQLDVRQLIRNQMMPQQKLIESLNQKKNKIRDELNKLHISKNQTSNQMDEEKLKKMRQLYQQSDQLKQKYFYYLEHYSQQIMQEKQKYTNIQKNVSDQYQRKINELIGMCQQQQKQCQQAKINYVQLMKEQAEQGKLYKETMLQQMANELKMARQRGEQLRKIQNKTNHENLKCQDKMKYFQQLITEINIDIGSSSIKNQQLKDHLSYLSKVLHHKDKQIFDQQKNVKELLTNNINNYSHEEYLKHRQQELLSKATFLENQIQDLQNKYKTFQDNFIQATKQSNQYSQKISQCIQKIKNLKALQKKLEQNKYHLRYQQNQCIGRIQQSIKINGQKQVLIKQLKQILNQGSLNLNQQQENKKVLTLNNVYKSGNLQTQTNNGNTNINENKKSSLISSLNLLSANTVQETLCQRDHMIKQVINTNNLRKIDDTIRRTIMLKLNRETVTLTCQVNQLRKEKRNLTNKIKQLRGYITDLKEIDGQNLMKKKSGDDKENISLHDIVPPNADISIIRSNNSKSIQKMLPFQLYHQSKTSHGLSALSHVNLKGSYHHSKHNTKSQYDQSSTQLPSILKNGHNSHLNNSSVGTSRLYGVEQKDDQILQ